MPRFLSRKLQFDFDLPVPEKEFLQALGSRLLKPQDSQDAVNRHHQDEMKHFWGGVWGGDSYKPSNATITGVKHLAKKGGPSASWPANVRKLLNGHRAPQEKNIQRSWGGYVFFLGFFSGLVTGNAP